MDGGGSNGERVTFFLLARYRYQWRYDAYRLRCRVCRRSGELPIAVGRAWIRLTTLKNTRYKIEALGNGSAIERALWEMKLYCTKFAQRAHACLHACMLAHSKHTCIRNAQGAFTRYWYERHFERDMLPQSAPGTTHRYHLDRG